MMDKETLISNYFSNRLSQADEKHFHELLETDSDFKKQFDFERDLQLAIKNKENQSLKSKLISFEAEIEKETPHSTTKKNNRYLAIAASIALLMGLAWMGYTDGQTDNFDDLYASNFQEYPNTVYTITRGDTAASLEREAFVAYESKQYDTAITKFEQIDAVEQKTYIDFYLALSYLNTKQFDTAKEVFRKVIANDADFVAESYWYLAMIALKQKDKSDAINALNILIDGYAYKKEEAAAILKALN